jgi:ribose/xylose/arabinose/galactoside ABC-type transport system permease subunit
LPLRSVRTSSSRVRRDLHLFSIVLYDRGFLDPNNLLNIVRQAAMIAIMAVAMTLMRVRPVFRLSPPGAA